MVWLANCQIQPLLKLTDVPCYYLISGSEIPFVLFPHALVFSMPTFAHVSLILAPDRSKLSKRHGATSVGQVLVNVS